jgi:hypothetical protein
VAKSALRLVRPTTVNRTVTPHRLPNAELRTREHLTEREVERLIEAAKANRHGHRDGTMILLAQQGAAQSGSSHPIVAINRPRARASRDITVPIGTSVASAISR